MPLQADIEALYAADPAQLDRNEALRRFAEFKFFLNRGELRAAEKRGNAWRVNAWVKKGILLGFRLGELTDVSIDGRFRYFDKSTFPLKALSASDGVRLVPGGSAIRDGAFVARGVVCMPPMYINVGAYVDEGTMVDSHALVGSCAQVGKRVHIS
ncbi:MAG TPA: 2,3,4,5-tetrahydropyridine-2,6-dicarboxylate N-succinyltransferase, partial [Bacteroidota bacterium]|nr:2,3,4,5-tetrahydropyridine-2,6-dicarboxylate N-succinyltransferase [Bacteroidota bacterium]